MQAIAEAVKERPILFSAPMVRAILDGKKTQTRRIAKRIDDRIESSEGFEVGWFNPTVVDRHGEEGPGEQCFGAFDNFDGAWTVKCPYGAPGDRLWVQEEHVIHGRAFNLFDVSCSGDRRCVKVSDAELEKYKQRKIQKTPRLMRARFMYRSFSRITLEITGVRVERLQQISEADAQAEGVFAEIYKDENNFAQWMGRGAAPQGFAYLTGFKHIWHQINGEESWKANPWVWVVEFKRI